MRRIALGLVALLFVAGCMGGKDSSGPAPTPPAESAPGPMGPESPNGTVRFVVIGDTGQASEGQYAVSTAIETVCEERGCQFVLISGDNIYPNGVRSAYDPQFEEKFEEPYANLNLPFYLVLGNHDNGDGNGANPAVGDYEVEYSERKDRMSEKWNMPARYYTFRVGDVQIFGLDSGPQEVSQAQVWLPGTRGPAMQTWLGAEIAKSTAKWKFAFAHHPYVSNSRHGDAGLYDNTGGKGLPYRLMLEDLVCDTFQVFFAGHDHNLQWLKPVRTCGRTEFIVSGAGGASIYAKGVPPDNEVYFEDYAKHGFFWIEASGNTFKGVAFDQDANLLFERTFTA
ncbi:MAG: metallophosphoesterase [Euryarchaeota archaeon]|nr:metallophosphoesterase [Euryarchaeota archaeon]